MGILNSFKDSAGDISLALSRNKKILTNYEITDCNRTPDYRCHLPFFL